MLKILYTFFFSIAIVTLHAQDKIECDRPDQNESSSLVPAGYFQMESGFLYQRIDKDEQHIIYPTVLLKYGLGNIAELRVEVQNETERVHSEHSTEYHTGIDPVSIGAKIKICEEYKARPKTSVIISAGIPILASKELQDLYPSPEVRFTMQHTLIKDKITFAYNLGALCDGKDFKPQALYTVTSDFALTENLHTFVEFYGFMPLLDVKQEHHFDGGFTYTLGNNIMVDVSSGLDIKHHPGWFCSTGISLRLHG